MAKENGIGWNKDSGFPTLDAWLHDKNDRYYKERRKIADAGMMRAEELAGKEYPISAEKDKKLKKRLATFIKLGKERMKRTGKSGKAKGNWFAVVRVIQLNILSTLIAEKGGGAPNIVDVRCAGFDSTGIDQTPCPAYEGITVGADDSYSEPGWNPESGQPTLDAWLHDRKSRYYKSRKKLAEAAMKRAEELAAVEYPISAEEEAKSKRKLAKFIKEGKERMDRTGDSGRSRGDWYAVVRSIQLNILSNLLKRKGGNTPSLTEVKTAGLESHRKASRSLQTTVSGPTIQRGSYTVSLHKQSRFGASSATVAGLHVPWSSDIRQAERMSDRGFPLSKISCIPDPDTAEQVAEILQTYADNNLQSYGDDVYSVEIERSEPLRRGGG